MLPVTRLKVTAPRQATDPVGKSYAELTSKIGRAENIFQTMANSPAALRVSVDGGRAAGR